MIVALVFTLAACTGDEVPTPVQPLSTPQGPSQTEAEAERDGVPKEVAALTLNERLRLEGDPGDGTLSLTADDGVWRVSRPAGIAGYGEILLLGTRRERVQYAVPLDFLPHHLVATDDGDIWIASKDRQQWVRIDVDTLEIVERGTKGPKNSNRR
ncbi:MAG: hypothetical protein WD826_01715 [Actinomycetota bacterium]